MTPLKRKLTAQGPFAAYKMFRISQRNTNKDSLNRIPITVDKGSPSERVGTSKRPPQSNRNAWSMDDQRKTVVLESQNQTVSENQTVSGNQRPFECQNGVQILGQSYRVESPGQSKRQSGGQDQQESSPVRASVSGNRRPFVCQSGVQIPRHSYKEDDGFGQSKRQSGGQDQRGPRSASVRACVSGGGQDQPESAPRRAFVSGGRQDQWESAPLRAFVSENWRPFEYQSGVQIPRDSYREENGSGKSKRQSRGQDKREAAPARASESDPALVRKEVVPGAFDRLHYEGLKKQIKEYQQIVANMQKIQANVLQKIAELPQHCQWEHVLRVLTAVMELQQEETEQFLIEWGKGGQNSIMIRVFDNIRDRRGAVPRVLQDEFYIQLGTPKPRDGESKMMEEWKSELAQLKRTREWRIDVNDDTFDPWGACAIHHSIAPVLQGIR